MTMPPKYRIVSHPDWGFCAMVDARRGAACGADWRPLDALGTTGPGGDSYRATIWRGDFWVETQAEAHERIDIHATEAGISVVWAGG